MSPSIDRDAETPERRQRWLSLLAKAPATRLEALWNGITSVPAYTMLRRPEIGLVMVQGRISGSGAPFCAGEMTVTRAAVRLQSGQIGIGYVGGRHPRQAEIVAAIDALGQLPEWHEAIEAEDRGAARGGSRGPPPPASPPGPPPPRSISSPSPGRPAHEPRWHPDIAPGFADPSHDAQRLFRARARRLRPIPAASSTVAGCADRRRAAQPRRRRPSCSPWSIATRRSGSTPEFDRAAVRDFVRFHTGAPIVGARGRRALRRADATTARRCSTASPSAPTPIPTAPPPW